MQHLRRGAARVQQLLFRYCLLVNNTDTGINPHIRVHYGRFIHRDTDIFVEKADYAMACCGELNLSGILTLRPLDSMISMSL